MFDNISPYLHSLLSLHVAAGLLVFGSLWITQLINCCRRRNLPPMFGTSSRARTAWMISFFSLTPIQILLYLIVVRWGVLGKRERFSQLRTVVFSLVISAGILLSYGWVGSQSNAPKSYPESTPTSALSMSAGVKSSSIGGTSATSSTSQSPFAQGHLRVVCESDHPILVAAAQKIALDLAALPFVDTVKYFPINEIPVGGAGPDATLIIGADSLSSLNTAGVLSLSATIRASYSQGVTRVTSTVTDVLPLRIGKVKASFEGDFKFSRVGLAWGAALHGEAGDEIAKWITESLLPKMREVASTDGVINSSRIPQTYSPPPKIAALSNARELHQVFNESAPFIHNQSAWTYEDDSANAMQKIIESLQAEGWKASMDVNDAQRMKAQRGHERIWAFRRAPNVGFKVMPALISGEFNTLEPQPTKKPAYLNTVYFSYTNFCNDEEIAAIKETLLADNPTIEERILFTPKYGNGSQDLLNILIQNAPMKAGQCMIGAKLAKQFGQDKDHESFQRRAYLLAKIAGETLPQGLSVSAQRPLDLSDLKALEIPIASDELLDIPMQKGEKVFVGFLGHRDEAWVACIELIGVEANQPVLSSRITSTSLQFSSSGAMSPTSENTWQSTTLSLNRSSFSFEVRKENEQWFLKKAHYTILGQ